MFWPQINHIPLIEVDSSHPRYDEFLAIGKNVGRNTTNSEKIHLIDLGVHGKSAEYLIFSKKISKIGHQDIHDTTIALNCDLEYGRYYGFDLYNKLLEAYGLSQIPFPTIPEKSHV